MRFLDKNLYAYSVARFHKEGTSPKEVQYKKKTALKPRRFFNYLVRSNFLFLSKKRNSKYR